jgi:hypothetical protein
MKVCQLLILPLLVIVLASCVYQDEPANQNRWGYGGTEYTTPSTPRPPAGPPLDAAANTGDPLASTPPASVVPSIPVAPPVPVEQSVPWGIPVEGKPGFIRSPFSPNAGQVDARGFPPGTEIKDPYNPGKLLMVP